jgi:plastocyanin
VLLLGLTAAHKIGLLVMGLIFIFFSLFSAFVAPRRWANYPGRFFSVFIVGCFVLFALMIAAVEVFGAEPEESAKASESAPAAGQKRALAVSESEWKVVLPPSAKLKPGTYTLHVTNKGTVVHNLYVNGPGVKNKGTRNLNPGQSANLTVTLGTGTYDVYCAIPGHKQLGMDAKLPVG